MILEAQSLSWSVGGQSIVKNASLYLAKGECVGLIGPNGCGKSSLMRMLYRILSADSGQVKLHGQDIWRIPVRQFAQEVAVLSQESYQVFDYTVREAVMMGRIPHQSQWARDSDTDRLVVQNCLEQVGAIHLLEQPFSLLSGGEKQRVLFARALAQQPQLLFLDEPTNHLDIKYQLELMGLLKKSGNTALVAIHDLNIAAHYCDRLYLMQNGELIAQGTPQEVLTPESISAVYGVQAAVDQHPVTQRLRISYWTDGLYE